MKQHARSNSQAAARRTVKIKMSASDTEKKVIPVRELVGSKCQIISRSDVLKKKGKVRGNSEGDKVSLSLIGMHF